MKRFIKILCAASLLIVAAGAYAANTNTPPSTTPVNAVNANKTNVSPAERAKVEEIVHEYLLRQPEVLVQAMQALQQKQYAEAEKAVKQTQEHAYSFSSSLFHDTKDPVVGNPKGTITVVEFFDYQCPHCSDMAPVFDGILKANPNLRIVFKEFPIRGPMSDLAARAALAANKQGKYYEYSHALLDSKQPLTPELLEKIATQVGLNIAQWKKDKDDSNIQNQLKANIKLAQELKLFGTPALFIGKTDASKPGSISYVPGQMTQAQLQEAIDKSGK